VSLSPSRSSPARRRSLSHDRTSATRARSPRASSRRHLSKRPLAAKSCSTPSSRHSGSRRGCASSRPRRSTTLANYAGEPGATSIHLAWRTAGHDRRHVGGGGRQLCQCGAGDGQADVDNGRSGCCICGKCAPGLAQMGSLMPSSCYCF